MKTFVLILMSERILPPDRCVLSVVSSFIISYDPNQTFT